MIVDHYRFYLKHSYRTEPYRVTDLWLKPNRDQLIFSVFSEISNHHHASTLLPTGRGVSGFDQAYSRQILTQLLLGNVLTEAEFPTDEGFFTKVGDWVRKWGSKEGSSNHDEIRRSAVKDLDQIVLGRSQDGGLHYRYESASSGMADCLRNASFQLVSGPGQYAIEKRNPDGSRTYEKKIVRAPRAEDLVRHLEQGHPVGCSLERYVFDLEDGIQIGPHMVVVVGYRRTAEKGLEFRVRDSNFESHLWVKLNGCDEFSILK